MHDIKYIVGQASRQFLPTMVPLNEFNRESSAGFQPASEVCRLKACAPKKSGQPTAPPE